MNIVFAGTPDFAATALATLLKTDHNIVAVYSQPDRPAGRGRKLVMSAVKTLALEHNIPVYQPTSLKDQAAQAELAALKPDVMIVAAYGLLLPETVLNIPRYGCINIHASLLPRWRGAAPIQHAILAGDTQTGITIMQMDKGLDTGNMLHRQTVEITNTTTGGELHDTLAQMGAECIVKVLDDLAGEQRKPEQQDNALATYASKIEKAHAQINWQHTATEIDRLIRAYNPWPVAYSTLADKTIRVWQADIINEQYDKIPGTIIDVSTNGIIVQCAESDNGQALCLTELQLPNARRMSVRDILNGHSDMFQPGQYFGNH